MASLHLVLLSLSFGMISLVISPCCINPCCYQSMLWWCGKRTPCSFSLFGMMSSYQSMLYQSMLLSVHAVMMWQAYTLFSLSLWHDVSSYQSMLYQSMLWWCDKLAPCSVCVCVWNDVYSYQSMLSLCSHQSMFSLFSHHWVHDVSV